MSNKGKLIYSLVGKGTKPLAGYSNFTGTFVQACINYLPQIGPNASGLASVDDYYIIFINESNITYLVMTDNTYPKEAALGCLESIKKEFQALYPDTSFDNVSNFGLNDQFQAKLRMKFDYFNANQDVSNESIARIKEELNKFKQEVLDASGLLNTRGEKIKVLDEKADSLSRDSSNFYNQSKRVKRAELMRKIKLYAAIGAAILVILYILICICCSWNFKC